MDLIKSFKSESENGSSKDKTVVRYSPPVFLIDAKVSFDHTKCTSDKNPLIVIFEKSKKLPKQSHRLFITIHF
jgi:hypothetical protein